MTSHVDRWSNTTWKNRFCCVGERVGGWAHTGNACSGAAKRYRL